MKRAKTLLVSVLLAASVLGATAQGALAYRADVWSNSNSFSSRCLGFTDTYPQQLYSLARSQMIALGYSPVGGAVGSSFTRSAFISGVLPDWGVYVHTHGDNYWASSGYPNIDSAVLQDPGTSRCSVFSTDAIRSSTIKSATAGAPYNLVIMSTCMLGSSSSTMPGAFQIEKVKNSTQREFYLGYVNLTYDSAQLRFEQAFWSYLNATDTFLGIRRSVYEAFTYATGIGGYAAPDSGNPFQANWWGNPNYNGTPG
jgi:hypothetical protein